jgi:ribonuclease P protein component
MPGFPKSNRLILKKDFDAVFKVARKVSHKNLLALYRSNELDHARLGIIIKKQFVKLAVRRNRYRRWIRESFRLAQDGLKGLDIIVLMRSECSPNDKLNFQDDITLLWQKLSKK